VSALATGDARCRRLGREHGVVDGDRDHARARRAHSHLLDDVASRLFADGDHPRHAPRDLVLHVVEVVPAAQRQPAPQPGLACQLEVAVDHHGVVHAGHHGQARPMQAEDPPAEALVVVHDIEAARPRREQATCSQAEGERLRERRGAQVREFEHVDPVAELVEAGRTERVVGSIQVEAGHRLERDSGIEVRVRLTREDGDLVAQPGQRCRELPDVHALAARVRVAAVAEQGDTQRRGIRHGGRC
jgi:hypothetical protein